MDGYARPAGQTLQPHSVLQLNQHNVAYRTIVVISGHSNRTRHLRPHANLPPMLSTPTNGYKIVYPSAMHK